jgi:hypothetical protein
MSGGFLKPMAKAPTVTFYSNTSGAVNTVRDATNGVDRAASVYGSAENGFSAIVVTGAPSTAWMCNFHYTADTSW